MGTIKKKQAKGFTIVGTKTATAHKGSGLGFKAIVGSLHSDFGQFLASRIMDGHKAIEG